MPIKIDEINSGTLYIQNDSGEYVKFGNVNLPLTPVDLTSEEIPSDESACFIRPDDFIRPDEYECEFSFTIDRISRKNIVKLVIGTNNWRKMHGLPMRSYKRYQHERH